MIGKLVCYGYKNICWGTYDFRVIKVIDNVYECRYNILKDEGSGLLTPYGNQNDHLT